MLYYTREKKQKKNIDEKYGIKFEACERYCMIRFKGKNNSE